MSFPRAKIQRFNDINTNTPSPAEYNPLNCSNPTGAVIPRSSRFTDPKSPTNSHNTSIGSASSLNNSCFRSPQVFKKKKSPGSGNGSSASPPDLEVLREKIVECANKDVTITELSQNLEQMKEKMSVLQSDYQTLEEMKFTLEKEKDSLQAEHGTEKAEISKEYNAYKGEIGKQILNLKQELEFLKSGHLNMANENNGAIDDIKQQIQEVRDVQNISIGQSEELLKAKCSKLEQLEHQMEELHLKESRLVEEFETEMKSMNLRHEEEMETEQKCFKNTLADTQGIIDKYKIVIADLEERISDSRKMYSDLLADKSKEELEEQLHNEKQKYEELEKLQENHQEQLKDQKVVLEETFAANLNAIKSELNTEMEKLMADKMQLQKLIDEKTKLLDEARLDFQKQLKMQEEVEMQCKNFEKDLELKTEVYKKLQKALDSEMEERKTIVQKAIADRDTYEGEINKLLSDTKALNEELTECKKTIETLSISLVGGDSSKLESIANLSHKYTENIDIVSETIFKKILEFQMRIEEHETTFKRYVVGAQNDFDSSSIHLIDARQILFKQEELYRHIENLINNSDINVETLYKLFGEELDKFKCLKSEMVVLKKSTGNLRNENKKLAAVINKYMERTDSDQSRIKNLEGESKQLRELSCNVQRFYQEINEYVYKMKKMYVDCQLQIDNIERESGTAKGKNLELQEEYQKLLEKYQEVEDLKDRIIELEKTVAVQKSLIGPFREQLEAYENEHTALIGQKSCAEKELRTLGLKYAEILGHQNHKQKIKHLVDIKMKNMNLQQSNQALEGKFRAQAKVIDRLKKELSVFKGSPKKRFSEGNKENVFSPPNTPNVMHNRSTFNNL